MPEKKFSKGDVIKFLKPLPLRKLEHGFSTYIIDTKVKGSRFLDGLYFVESIEFESRASNLERDFSAKKIYAKLLGPDKIYDSENDSVGFNADNKYWSDYVSPENIKVCDKMVRISVKF
ncbi:hypothetical protein KAJ87_02910 [Candidatus Pacearchaeota archaeon]|nr:hypothetical protein [Candidatus Pacearchaeota archaeon]